MLTEYVKNTVLKLAKYEEQVINKNRHVNGHDSERSFQHLGLIIQKENYILHCFENHSKNSILFA